MRKIEVRRREELEDALDLVNDLAGQSPQTKRQRDSASFDSGPYLLIQVTQDIFDMPLRNLIRLRLLDRQVHLQYVGRNTAYKNWIAALA